MHNTSDKTIKQDTAHAHAIKQQIKEVFLELLKQKPVEQISIREITDAAYMNRTSFYRYFVDVYDVYYQVLDDHIVMFQEQLAIIVQKLFAQGDLYPEDFPFEFFEQYKIILKIVLRDPKSLERLKKNQKIFLKEYLHLDNTDPRIEYELEYIISGQIGLISYWLDNQMGLPVLALFTLVKQHIVSALDMLQRFKEHPLQI